ncbi:MAG: hypothetical protein JXR52_13030 [Bacteroidales bacterium]|nr:hypothetical protein [Bacteroidales bacterium]
MIVSCDHTLNRHTLLDDDFSSLRRGPLGSGSGAHTEYHYLPEAAPKGNWSISTFRYNLPESWYIMEAGGERYICQKAVNNDSHWHPMVISGDDLWQDYRVELTVEPGSYDKQCGLVFRYANDRCYYFFGVREHRVILAMVQHATGFRRPYEVLLAAETLPGNLDVPLHLDVTVSGEDITARINDRPALRVKDTTYQRGKIGLLADGPAKFYRVEVSTGKFGQRLLLEKQRARSDRENELQAVNPEMKLWKKISTEGFGTGRNLRFGDLNHDGSVDVLIGQVIHHGPKDRNSELSCITAMTFEGEVLWQTGRPDPWKTMLTNDVAFQIHDLDNDGKNEVIYCMNQKMIIAEAGTGKTIFERPTPPSPGGRPLESGHNIFPRILGDCLFFCDLRGGGYDGDVIIKDRYRYVWAFDSNLNLLWSNECNTGHYPYAFDVDGDGRDEVIMGYTLFDDDGEKIWSLDDTLQDHADGVAIVRLRDDTEPVFLCAASDEGLFFADMRGNILRHHYVGHVQNPAVANFRDDLPGLETVSVNFWGNQGIINLYDSDGAIFHSFEPNQYGSLCLPLNWTGSSEEYFVLNPNVDEGGAYNGYGKKVLDFPDDGHPDMCYAVLDVTGDCRDEIVVWDPHEIWIYTQDSKGTERNLYRPCRNPLYNYSNYQATVSLPEWSENQISQK